MELSPEELSELYTWVRKNNDAQAVSFVGHLSLLLIAEVAYHFFPKLVQLHNYSAANSLAQKMYNWNTLNAKVFSKLGFMIPKADCEATAQGQPMAIEKVLRFVHGKFAEISENGGLPKSPISRTLSNSGSLKGSSGPLSGPLIEERPPGGKTHRPADAAVAPVSEANTTAAANSHQHHQQQQTIRELREMNEILETKTRKLEQLVRLKDAKIQTLTAKLQAVGL